MLISALILACCIFPALTFWEAKALWLPAMGHGQSVGHGYQVVGSSGAARAVRTCSGQEHQGSSHDFIAVVLSDVKRSSASFNISLASIYMPFPDCFKIIFCPCLSSAGAISKVPAKRTSRCKLKGCRTDFCFPTAMGGSPSLPRRAAGRRTLLRMWDCLDLLLLGPWGAVTSCFLVECSIRPVVGSYRRDQSC